MVDRARAGEDDVAVVVQAEAWVVRDLPRVPVEITESAGISSVESLRRARA